MWKSITDRVLGVPLSTAQLEQLAEEDASVNQWRLQRVLPLMIVMNLFHVAFLLEKSPIGTAFPDALQPWVQGLMVVHAVTALVAIVPLGMAWMMRRPPRWTGAFGVLIYQLHAAAIAGVDQLNHGTVAPYVAYTLVNVFVVVLTPLQALSVFGFSTLAFIAAIWTMQPDPILWAAVSPTGPSVLIPALCLVWFLHNNRRREFYFRETISEQRADLERLNAQLKETVEVQVESLRVRAREVEGLNARLRDQVRDRSKALALALGRLAEREAPNAADLSGQLFGGRYLLAECLGAGGMGIVYAATDVRTDQQVAVKLLRRLGAVSRDSVARFIREAESAATVRHPAIVRMLHVDVTDEGVLFQVQERVEGQTLADLLEQTGVMKGGVAFPLLVTLCGALHAAHEQGVVHRDVKPSNVMLVGNAPGLKLLDFGIARIAESATSSLTATGALIGTPAFMAPELWDGEKAVPATDVFAVGVMAIRMLTGSLPKVRQVMELETLDGHLSARASAVLQRCMADCPSDRPTALELSRVFAAFGDKDGPSDAMVPSAFDPVAIDHATHLTFGE